MPLHSHALRSICISARRMETFWNADAVHAACVCLSSDVWVGEFEKSTSKLSTSDAAKKSATAVLEVCLC